MRTIDHLSTLLRPAIAAAAITVTAVACGGGGPAVEGTYVHVEEGTIVLGADGAGSIDQSGAETAFEWQADGNTIEIVLDGETVAEATLEGDELTFRPGDFSGDDAVTFDRR